MEWVAWAGALVVQSVPVGALILDRAFDHLPARRTLLLAGLPALVLFVLVAVNAWAAGSPLLTLLWVGGIAGILSTAALDAVRLVGVRLGLFPADMPIMFGVIGHGLAPTLQRNMLATMVRRTAALDPEERTSAMRARVEAMARLSSERRQMVVTGMMTGLAWLPEDQRQSMLQTQMQLLSELPSEGRRRIMAAMDLVMGLQSKSGDGLASVPLPYVQPRGMPQLPMATFRSLFEEALPLALRESGVSLAAIRWAGYLWHFLIGITFAVTYLLLFGAGSWALAIGWGAFIWLGMMVVMPRMMPMVRFPLWFVIWPLIAHIAFALPYGFLALNWVGPEAASVSLLGALGLL